MPDQAEVSPDSKPSLPFSEHLHQATEVAAADEYPALGARLGLKTIDLAAEHAFLSLWRHGPMMIAVQDVSWEVGPHFSRDLLVVLLQLSLFLPFGFLLGNLDGGFTIGDVSSSRLAEIRVAEVLPA